MFPDKFERGSLLNRIVYIGLGVAVAVSLLIIAVALGVWLITGEVIFVPPTPVPTMNPHEFLP